jgi:hypothetical protein
MQYVMVPVPPELVAQVEHYLAWNTGRAESTWDHDAAARFLDALDPRGRSLLVQAADASFDARILTCAEVAAALDCSELEVLGRAIELNESCRRAGGPVFLVTANVPDDVDGVAQPRRLDMPIDVARRVLDASGRGIPVDS